MKQQHECHPAFALSQVGKAPAVSLNPECRKKKGIEINKSNDLGVGGLFDLQQERVVFPDVVDVQEHKPLQSEDTD